MQKKIRSKNVTCARERLCLRLSYYRTLSQSNDSCDSTSTILKGNSFRDIKKALPGTLVAPVPLLVRFHTPMSDVETLHRRRRRRSTFALFYERAVIIHRRLRRPHRDFSFPPKDDDRNSASSVPADERRPDSRSPARNCLFAVRFIINYSRGSLTSRLFGARATCSRTNRLEGCIS